jgi:hypothetical protein
MSRVIHEPLKSGLTSTVNVWLLYIARVDTRIIYIHTFIHKYTHILLGLGGTLFTYVSRTCVDTYAALSPS